VELIFLLGGGVPGGAIVLIEESKRTNGYADAIAKLFLAEGLFQKNRIYLASDGTVSCSDFLQTLPQAVVDESAGEDGGETYSATNNMEIAWRYEHLPVKNTQVTSGHRRQRHHFDLSKPISMGDLQSYKNLDVYDANSEQLAADKRSHYDSILAQLKHKLFNSESNDSHDNALWHRILIRQIGSPLWQKSDDQDFSSDRAEPIHFLASLRAFVRQKSTAVAVITISTAFVEEGSPLLHRIRQLSDVVFRLDPINVGEKEKSTLDYHGFFRCFRTPSINSISHPSPDCADYAFKLKKKEFLIERLHLPPDLSETASRSQLETMSCASTSSKSKLDF